MLKKTLSAASVVIVIFALAIVMTYNARDFLFHSLGWVLELALILGILTGIIRGIMHNSRVQRSNPQPDRHTLDSFLEHWGTAGGIFILLISGFFILGDYRRGFSANLHFLGLVITLYFGTYFLAHFFVSKKYRYLLPGINDILGGTVKKYLLGADWKDTGKYLSSQKSAFLTFVIVGIGIFLTGTIKLAAFYFSIPGQLKFIVTRIHDYLTFFFLFFLLIHILLALITGSNRRKFTSFFTGKINGQG
jgi:thiosulfate reductase cytochrome b subunit